MADGVVSGASLNGTVLTLTVTDAADVTVDLATLPGAALDSTQNSACCSKTLLAARTRPARSSLVQGETPTSPSPAVLTRWTLRVISATTHTPTGWVFEGTTRTP